MAQSFTMPAGFAGTTSDAAPAAKLPTATSLLARLRSLLPGRAPSEVEAYITANGGVLTDDLERDISRRFGSAAGI